MTLDNTHKYSRSGWGFIFLSIACVFIFLVDYKTKFIFNLTSISELGTILGGTSGIFASLAGLFFVLENLELQRQTIKQQQNSITQQQVSIDLQREELRNQIQEMKESNDYFKQQTETLKTQTSESAFFQLLENHRSLVKSLNFNDSSGYDGLTKFYLDLKLKTTHFFQAAHTGNVSKTEFSSYYPLYLLYTEIENTEQLYNNIFHLIKLIQLKLADSVFYHDILYNSLSKAEKYIVAMYVINEKEEGKAVFQTDAFNYLKEFEGSGNAYFSKRTVPYYPNLSFNFEKHWNSITVDEDYNYEISDKAGQIEIKTVQNFGRKKIILKDVTINYNYKGNNYNEKESGGFEVNESEKINVFRLINNHVFPKFVERFDEIKKSFPFEFIFDLVFLIDYDGREYRYTKRLNCSSHNTYEGGADLDIRERTF